MGSIEFVVWRECIEAFLVIGVFHTWLRREGRATRAVWLGVGGGVALAAALGAAMLLIQGELAGQALEGFEAAILLLAAGLVTHMVLWMRRHGRGLKASLEREAAAAADRHGDRGVALVVALAIAREGAELVVFLYGLAFERTVGSLALGVGGGFVAALATAWIAARGLARLNVALLLRVTAVLLLLFAGSLLVAGCERLIGLGWLPGLVEPLWNSSGLLDDASGVGRVVAEVAGYRAQPSLTVLLVFATYWGFVRHAFRHGRAAA